jgi:hypothetical protein
MPTNASVQITYDPDGKPPLTISPANASVVGQGTVTWTVSGPPGSSVVVTFSNGECPFPPTGEQPEGEYPVSSSTTTQPASYGTNGNWTYTVQVGTSKAGPQTEGGVSVSRNP